MSPRYLQAAAGNRNRWMVSYLDVVTLLLVFFLAAAAKELERPAVRTVPTPLPAVTAQTPSPQVELEPARAALLRAQERLRQQGLDSKMESRGLVISLSQVILFPSGEDAVSPAALPMLSQIADVLRDLPDHNVRLIGHADTVPIHNRHFRSNWDLSMARSLKIMELLNVRYAIPESRISIASYGPYRPAAPNDTMDGRASNRRVEILILDEGPEARSAEFAP